MTEEILAQYGHLDALRTVHSIYSSKITTSVLEAAAAGGQLKVVEWAHDVLKSTPTRRAFFIAAKGGHLDVVKYLYLQNKRNMNEAMRGAVMRGHINVVEWLLERTPDKAIDLSHGNIRTAAIYSDTLPMLEWLWARGTIGKKDVRHLIEGAAGYGSINVLRWLAGMSMLDLADTMFGLETAAMACHDRMAFVSMKYLYWRAVDLAPGEVDVASLIEIAVQNGNKERADWLRAAF